MLPPRSAESWRRRSEYFKRTNLLFNVKRFLKMTNKITGNSISRCDFFKFIISVRGGHCGYSPQPPKTKNSYATDIAVGYQLLGERERGGGVNRCTKSDLKMELLINRNVIWSSEVLLADTTLSKPSGMCMHHQVEHRKL